MSDSTNMFPIGPGNRIDVQHEECPQWGFSCFSGKQSTSIELDADQDTGHRYAHWYIVDTDGDNKVDFAIVNKISYADNQACEKRETERHPEDPSSAFHYCKHPVTFYLASDAVQNNEVSQLLDDVHPDFGSSIKIVDRGNSAELAAAQATYDQVMNIRQQLKERFLAEPSYGYFDYETSWLQNVDNKANNDQLEIEGYKKGTEACFDAGSDKWHPELNGTLDGVHYMFTAVPFSNDEIKSICGKITSNKSYDKSVK